MPNRVRNRRSGDNLRRFAPDPLRTGSVWANIARTNFEEEPEQRPKHSLSGAERKPQQACESRETRETSKEHETQVPAAECGRQHNQPPIAGAEVSPESAGVARVTKATALHPIDGRHAAGENASHGDNRGAPRTAANYRELPRTATARTPERIATMRGRRGKHHDRPEPHPQRPSRVPRARSAARPALHP